MGKNVEKRRGDWSHREWRSHGYHDTPFILIIWTIFCQSKEGCCCTHWMAHKGKLLISSFCQNKICKCRDINQSRFLPTEIPKFLCHNFKWYVSFAVFISSEINKPNIITFISKNKCRAILSIHDPSISWVLDSMDQHNWRPRLSWILPIRSLTLYFSCF